MLSLKLAKVKLRKKWTLESRTMHICRISVGIVYVMRTSEELGRTLEIFHVISGADGQLESSLIFLGSSFKECLSCGSVHTEIIYTRMIVSNEGLNFKTRH